MALSVQGWGVGQFFFYLFIYFFVVEDDRHIYF